MCHPVTVITGGSRGIGFAIAEEFAKRGHEIVLVARDATRLDEARRRLLEGMNRGVHTLALDLAGASAVDELDRFLASRGLETEYLVVNAAAAVWGRFDTAEPARLRSCLDLNVGFTTELIRRFLPRMVSRRRGGILNVASLAGLIPFPDLATYSATKAYVVSLSRSLAEEVRASGVGVSVLAPGPVATEFLERAGQRERHLVQMIQTMQASTVARVAYDGLMGRRVVIVPGLVNTTYYAACLALPQRLLIGLLRLVARSDASDHGQRQRVLQERHRDTS